MALEGLGPEAPECRYLPRVRVEVTATREQPPALRRRALARARLRKTSLVVARLRDPADGFAEMLLDVVYADPQAGVAVLTDLRLFTATGAQWFLVPKRAGEVILRLVHSDGLVPMLTPPWHDERQERDGLALAEDLLTAFVWDVS